MAKPTTKPMALADEKTRLPEEPQGDDRLGRPPLGHDEEAGQDDTADDRGRP